jgi:hypothetical protein
VAKTPKLTNFQNSSFLELDICNKIDKHGNVEQPIPNCKLVINIFRVEVPIGSILVNGVCMYIKTSVLMFLLEN